jgi:hypothetical protein
MAAIVTVGMRIYAANQFKAGFADVSQNLYLFIGRTLPWTNDNTPPTPIDCVNEEVAAYLDMLAMKRINSTDVSLVIPRNTWAVNTVYTKYVHDIDLFDPTSGLPPFYVISDQLNVYKCMSNNNGASSTIQPTGTGTSVVTLADGYRWKYMFTVSSADVLKFVTPEWIPVRTLVANDGSNQWLVQQAAISGTIDRIDILTAGTQYTSVPTVSIIGDGTGATAVASVSGGNITAITVTSTGSNYTHATISITGGGVSANGATAKAIISPFLGHGADAVVELGGSYVLVNSKLINDENSTFTVNNDYRRIGIIQNPILNDGSDLLASALDYSQAVVLTFSSVTGTTFAVDELVTGVTSGATGTVLDFDSTNKLLRLVQVTGSFVPGESVTGLNATGVLLTITGTATGGSTSTITLANSASTTNEIYTGQTLLITGGTGIHQTAKITAYVGLTRTATVAPTFAIAPDNTSAYVIAKIVPPSVEPFSGNILYIENRRPIARASDQQENIQILISF